MTARPSRRRAFSAFLLGFAIACSLCAAASAQGCGGFRVLVFSKTAGFRHGEQIVAGLDLIRRLGAANGFAVDATEDATEFNDANLSQYAVVVFLNTTGDVLDAAQEASFEAYSRAGGGYVGIHSAADTEYAWPYYGALMGAWFASHPAVQSADLVVVHPGHPSTAHLPARFSHRDEWYNYRTNPANEPTITVLLALDESTYTGGTMGAVHPIAWYREMGGVGRSWYTGLGHTVDTYTAAFFERHLLGGILWASGSLRMPTTVGIQTYGAGSGTPSLALSGSLVSPLLSELVLANATAGSSGALLLSTCSASLSLPPWTVLVDVSSTHFLGTVPVVFDGAGQAKLTLPRRFSLPAFAGTALFFQGAQVGPSAGLSNGLLITLQP